MLAASYTDGFTTSVGFLLRSVEEPEIKAQRPVEIKDPMTSDVLVMEAETGQLAAAYMRFPNLRVAVVGARTRTVQLSANPSSNSQLISFWNLDLAPTSLKSTIRSTASRIILSSTSTIRSIVLTL